MLTGKRGGEERERRRKERKKMGGQMSSEHRRNQFGAEQCRKELSLKCQRKKGEEVIAQFLQKSPTVAV